jgi:hypothetical protein
VPFLQRILTLLNSSPTNDANWSKYLKIPDVVRVETGLDVNVALSNEAVVTESDISNSDTKECGDTSSGLERTFSSMAMDIDTLEKGIGVAWEFDGYGILRGFIQKSENDSFYEEGSFVLKFTNGKRLKMGETKAKEARYARYVPQAILNLPCTQRVYYRSFLPLCSPGNFSNRKSRSSHLQECL